TLASASYALADVAADIASYAATIDTDPARLAAVSERRAVLGGLTRKYGDTLAEVLDWATQGAARLSELTDDDSRVDALRAEQTALEAGLSTAGTRLSDLRDEAGSELSRRVTAELASLAMGHSLFTVTRTDLPAPGPHGVDEVVFTL